MKPFIHTSIAAAVFILVAVLFIALHKIENYKEQVEQQKEMIYEIKEELHTYQIMYLKCAGNIEADNYEVEYLEGKLKFCKTK
jgi:predicted membrane-bound spermidine synthase